MVSRDTVDTKGASRIEEAFYLVGSLYPVEKGFRCVGFSSLIPH